MGKGVGFTGYSVLGRWGYSVSSDGWVDGLDAEGCSGWWWETVV